MAFGLHGIWNTGRNLKTNLCAVFNFRLEVALL